MVACGPGFAVEVVVLPDCAIFTSTAWGAASRSHSVLTFDDDEGSSFVWRLVNSDGCEMTSLLSEAEATALLTGLAPRLLLSDVCVPVGHCQYLAQRLSAAPDIDSMLVVVTRGIRAVALATRVAKLSHPYPVPAL